MSKIFDGVLIASDVDGTLTPGDLYISERNYEAIKYFTDNGGMSTVATGRMASYMREKFPRLIINAPVSAVNGTMVSDIDTGEILWKRPMNESYIPMIETVKELCTPLILQLFDDFGTVSGYEYDKNVMYNKMLCVTKTEQDALMMKTRFEKEFPRLYFSRSWDTGFEATDINAHKGETLKEIKRITKAKITVGIGNYENDDTLIKEADFGVAVSNSIQSIKDVADFITENDAEFAVAELIEKLPKLLRL